MRLWHKDLIYYLSRLQLLGQWRECCLIARLLATKGFPNHMLVNRVMDYDILHFYMYCINIHLEMKKRGYRSDFSRLQEWIDIDLNQVANDLPKHEDLFAGWHDDIYLRECLYNLEEKARAGGMPQEDWLRIYEQFKDFTPLVKLVDTVPDGF